MPPRTTAHGRAPRSRRWLLAVSLAALPCCDRLPRDPEGTFERVTEGVLRVGVVRHEPWIRTAGPEPRGVEAEMVRRLAQELRAEVEWVIAPEQNLFEALERFRLDLVVGGLTRDSPWRQRVAFTSPYLKAPIEVGAPRGQPAIDAVDGRRVAAPEGSALLAMIEEQDGIPVGLEPDHLPSYDGLIAAPHWQLLAWGRVPTGIELHESRHVWAVPPGENRWLVYVERFLHRQEGEAEAMLRTEAGGQR